jgi:hypothetical protein
MSNYCILILQQEEEAARQKLKEEEAAAAEFDKWKSAFSVEVEGTEEKDAGEEGQGLLNNFVDYIKVSNKPFPSRNQHGFLASIARFLPEVFDKLYYC